MITPRPYQQEAHDAVVESWKRSLEPVVVEAATGAGKSIIIAMLAKTLHGLSSGKRVLCLAPSKELVEQNSQKYQMLGEPCSIYSASIDKSLRHQVIFATEGTFKRVARRLGPQFAGVIIDECHRITPTIKQIIADMREGSPYLRVCGLSATPYRLGEGFVFGKDPRGWALPETTTKNPYFAQLVYTISAPQLIDMGYLTPVTVGTPGDSYDTSGLKTGSGGRFTRGSQEKAFTGWGRKTATIVADIVAQSAGRRGVMIFAASVRHGEEILASLPPSSRLIGGKHNMKRAEREQLVADFKAQKFKYLVSVGTMTTGVDFTHVDVIALMRATESISLMQQMIGRGLRLHDGKESCLVLDYAENIARHCPDGDVFKPEIVASHNKPGELMDAVCEACSRVNKVSARPNPDGFATDRHGYFVDGEGHRIETDLGPLPAHFGRRCQHSDLVGREWVRCGYYWTSRECPECEHQNDIAARQCGGCGVELVDPNEKLIAGVKFDDEGPIWEAVESWRAEYFVSQSGNEGMRIRVRTQNKGFTAYYVHGTGSRWVDGKYFKMRSMTNNWKATPTHIRYKQNGDFWEILDVRITEEAS